MHFNKYFAIISYETTVMINKGKIISANEMQSSYPSHCLVAITCFKKLDCKKSLCGHAVFQRCKHINKQVKHATWNCEKKNFSTTTSTTCFCIKYTCLANM